MNNQPLEKQFVKEVLGQSVDWPRHLLDLDRQGELLACAGLDLSDSFQFQSHWLYITEKTVGVLSESGELLESIALEKITRSNIIEGFSSHRLSLFAEDELVFTALYSHRQKRAMGQCVHILEQLLEKKSLSVKKSAEDIYFESVFDPYEKGHGTNMGGESTVVWRLLKLLIPYKNRVILGGIAAALMTLVSLLPAYLTGYLVDNVIKPFQSGQLTHEDAMQIFAYTIIALAVTKVMREFFMWIRLRTMSILGEMVAKDLRDQVYSHLHKLSVSYFSSKQTGSLISRVSSDTDRLWDFIAFGVVEVMTSVIMLLGLSMVLLYLDWPLGLMVTLPVPIILWSIMKHGDEMRGLFMRCWRRWSSMTDCLSDTIPGIRVVKAFNKGEDEVERFKDRNQDCLNEFTGVHQLWTTFWPKLMLTIHVIVVGVWLFGVPRVLDHVAEFNATGSTDVGLTPGEFVAFVIYLTMFVQPIEVIGQMARMVNRATSSAYRVFEILDTDPQVVNLDQAEVVKDLKGEVEFKNVIFSYDGVRKILKGISFHVQPGEMIGLVGPSGSGKTTITNLLARFYDPQDGFIKVDGRNLNEYDQGSYREQLGMVLQEPYLFHGSILENVRYGRPDASLSEVVRAARAANAHEFILKLPQGYDTIVGERGHTLSGGERQRISIARAILRDPKILILDEATSAVDTETEKKIQQALDRLVQGRTVFAIAHRLSTLTRADRILVVKNGELVEEGTHSKLMSIEKGVYKKLVNMQTDLNKFDETKEV
tara:strand:+ start:13248 stop:15539 length:2292 start_codon:yes stop_codon:yes gene_type:complete